MTSQRSVIRCLLAPFLALNILLAGCTALPPGADQPKTASVAFSDPRQTSLGRRIGVQVDAHQPLSGFRMLSVGADGFSVRMQLIAAAEHSLDLQYYIFTADATGLLMTKAILDAADRGVHVRILIDDGASSPGDEQIEVLSAHPGIEVRMFNPFYYRGRTRVVRAVEFAFNASRLDYRMHNKLFVADAAAGLVGGRNVGDEYFQIDPQAQVADDDVFATGPVVQSLLHTFDDFWNSPLAIPVASLPGGRPGHRKLERHRRHLQQHWSMTHAGAPDYLKRAQSGIPLEGMLKGDLPLVWSTAQVVCDSPDKKKIVHGEAPGHLLYAPIAKALSGVKRQFTMITPYLVPTPEEITLLRELRERGVRVRILTNSLNSTNELTAHSGYVHYRRQLLEAGVELFEVRAQLGPHSRGSGQSRAISSFGHFGLHAKLLVFDEDALYAGSMNFDQRSRRLNTELGVIIESPALAHQTLQRFAQMTQPGSAYALEERTDDKGRRTIIWKTVENEQPVVYAHEPSRSPWRRIAAAFLSILPLDGEL